MNVTNNGPQTATGIELSGALSPQARFISVNTSQGTCTEEEGTIGCKLNQLTSTSTAVVTIVVKPTDEGSAIPPSGRIITNTVFAKAVEIDTDLSNNTSTETSTVLPESNAAPTVNITGPEGGSLFAGPATIAINLTAADADGSVSAVEVYADGEPIGSATSTGGGSYTLTWDNVDFGPHTLIATARDNQNRIGVSAPISLIVNGAATVNITSPTNLAMITTQNVVVTANASIAGATIDKVEFYADGFAFIGSGLLSGPDQYTLTWVSPSAGSHKLVAVATDSNGLTTTSGPVTFTVNDAPSLNFNSPVNGALYHAPGSIPFSVTANDGDGSVQRVEFLANGQVVRTVDANLFTSQFNSTWSNVAAGEYTMTAAVTDQQGAVTTSPPVQVTVNALPTVTITSPAPGSVFNAPANTTLVANASDSDGTVAGVNFYANGILIGPGTLTGPGQYSVDWAQSAPNNYALTAIASDNRGGSKTSTTVNVSVNAPPVVSIISPANNAAFATPASITLTASASDSGGSVTKVEFFGNGAFIGLGTAGGNGQYSYSWTSVAAGSYTLTAVATDNTALTTTSSPINITVNTPPAVSIVSPSHGAQLSAPANINIVANASDSDGTIVRVDFYANSTLVGTGTPDGGGQFNFTWSSVGIGNYSLTAVAIDNSGLNTTSAAVGISVTSPVLFVTNSTTLNSAENSVKARLEALNHTVIVKSAASAVTADAAGKALVVVSSTVTPTAVGTKFRTVTVPVLTWESGIYNNMGMTGSTNKDFGTKTNSTQVSITNPTHPLADGFSGNPTVATSGTFNWGKPNANASSVAIVVGDTAKTLLFGYDAGAVMPGLTAPARRVGFFMHDTTVLNISGTQLLDSAIRWAIGGGSITGNILLSPTGPVDLTTEGVFDWTHWGLNGPTAFNHKGLITPKITNFTLIGTGAVNWFLDSASTFSWIDGTPTQSASNTWAGVNINGVVGNGFEIRVPADTNLKTLKLYVGAWYAQGKLEATVSDGSAPAYINSALNNNGGGIFGLYTISYKAGSPGQTLKVRYTILNQYFAPNGNIGLKAAILQ